MSNPYLDWLRDGGVCCDCLYNVWRGRKCVCRHGEPSHKSERCDRFVDMYRKKED